jgi:hypothetical protein
VVLLSRFFRSDPHKDDEMGISREEIHLSSGITPVRAMRIGIY